MALINFGVGLGPSAAIAMVPYIAFDVLAGLDEAHWKFSGCLYFALVNLGPDANLAMAVAMVPYVIVDIFAYKDSAHWTPLAAGFIVLDAAMGALGLKAYLEAQKPSALNLKAE